MVVVLTYGFVPLIENEAVEMGVNVNENVRTGVTSR